MLSYKRNYTVCTSSGHPSFLLVHGPRKSLFFYSFNIYSTVTSLDNSHSLPQTPHCHLSTVQSPHMFARMLYQVLLSCLLYLSVYASPSKYSPRDVSKIQFPSLEKALVGEVSWFFFYLFLMYHQLASTLVVGSLFCFMF